MKAMKKTIAVLLTLCMVISMLAVAAVSVSAEETDATVTITAGIPMDWTGDYFVYYWYDDGGNKDVSLSKIEGRTVKKYIPDMGQTVEFNIYTADIPNDVSGYKVHGGSSWYGGNGSLDTPVAFVYWDGSGDKAVYQSEKFPLTAGYFLVGNFNSWTENTDYQLADDQGALRIKDVEISQNDQFKVHYYDPVTNNGAWYPEGYENFTANADGDYTVTVNPDPDDPDDPTKFTADYSAVSGSSLTIADGDIGLNLYFDMSSETKALPVDFFWIGMNGNNYKDVELTFDVQKLLYKATVNVPAPEMVCEIGFSYPLDRNYDYGEGKTSVGELAIEYRDNPDKYGQYESDLAGAMLNYGAQTQLQFAFKDTKLVVPDTIVPMAANQVLFYGDNDSDNVIIPNIAADALNDYNMQYAGCSLLLQTKTTLRFYFKKLSGYQDDPTVTYGDGELAFKPVENSTSYVYVDVEGINACDLGKAEILKVGNTELGTFSALSYVKLALARDTTTPQLKKTVTALYSYYWNAYKYRNTVAA